MSGEWEVLLQPSGKKLKARRGTTLLDAVRRSGLHLPTRCGGKAACMMCKVRDVSGAGLSMISDQERRKLGGMDEQGYRLACQSKIIGPVVIELPEDPLRAAVRRQLERQREEEDRLW
ncbi:2Fe-2S iron-sulfur cluster-binding protein [Paenibacillus sp. MMS18-CY102]|uniref:2Fe-2S iron-sulfur cluster-binding protein n=1 Tax=Paenibacillus sp. MMS18-CY102 TaxID=2682849 RepID=UPI0013652EB1|nr:2Fe-2S iron-sulfur cluster-binding protein [Paenibacillus sp. MMS18-CY102]MWC28455.1 2Fe-2S iron-sulfur cluster binding domain-containing protein [Paenibacillus sp. MMS18-CY102]